MKNIIATMAFVLTTCLAIAQEAPAGKSTQGAADTSKVMLHPDANTAYVDENGNSIDQARFMAAMSRSGYSFDPIIESGKVKALKLKKTVTLAPGNNAAPDFDVTDILGHPYSLSGLKGKTIVVNFWFIHCAACVQEMPELNRLREKYRSDTNVVFLAITFDPEDQVQAFLSKKQFNYSIVAEQSAMVMHYGIQEFPDNMVINARGNIVCSMHGYSADNMQQLEEFINSSKH